MPSDGTVSSCNAGPVSCRRSGLSYSSNQEIVTSPNYDWRKLDYPGGRQLWWRLVIGFSIVTLIGALFVVVSAVFLKKSLNIDREKGASLATSWCIIGIVLGTLLMISAIVLAKLTISNKWRTNEQPDYGQNRRNSRRVAAVNSPRSVTNELTDSPPPYTGRRAPPTIFIIDGGNIALAVPCSVMDVVNPPCYEQSTGGLPLYAAEDPCKPPIYNELQNSNSTPNNASAALHSVIASNSATGGTSNQTADRVTIVS